MRSAANLSLALGLCLSGLAGKAPASDLALAEKLTFSHCSACHTFKRDEPHGVGPNLYGLLNRAVGSAPGFTYSQGLLRQLGGQGWSRELLDAWLADTQAVAPGSTMTYFQDEPGKRDLIIRYFESIQ